MKLNKQLTILVEEAPKYGIASVVVEQAVVPVLKSFAQRLAALKYYIIKNEQGDLVITHLTHREKKGLEKTVIYAFLTPQDAQRFHDNNPLFIANEIPVTHLLFQLFALSTVDSIIFMDKAHNLLQGTEIKREELHTTILKHIQKLNPTYKA